jgi:hypothetical protein
MAEQIYIGNFPHGQVTIREPFVINNDSFPKLYNCYSWRGRVRRKRGTRTLGQLQIQEQSVATATPPLPWQEGTIMTLSGAGAGTVNLITAFSLGSTATIVPGAFTLSDGTNTYTDLNEDGTIQGTPSGSGTINYATGDLTITGGAANGVVVGYFSYYPGLPVMGLEEYTYFSSAGSAPVATLYPFTIAFDTSYAYQVNQSSSSVFFYGINYYKNTNNPVIWTGLDYQQFWTCNYQSAFWATNNKPGFHFITITNITQASSAVVTLSSSAGLVVGDYLYFNEVQGMTQINNLTGQITIISGNTVTVNINSSGFTAYSMGGIVQTLTANVGSGDGIRWYDGDPTSGTGIPTTKAVGWVNFSPPLTGAVVSIDDTPNMLYYLVGALAIVPFKDRLLFFGPWIQASDGSPAINLQNTVIWSQVGTPYYTVSSTSTNAAVNVPTGQIAEYNAWYQDQTGLGGNAVAEISDPIVTVGANQDVLIVGFGGKGRKTRLVFTGDNLEPFEFYNINLELPSTCTFSSVNLDQGMLDIGNYGIAMTDQQSAQRIDLDIPDNVFNIQGLNNGVQRVNSVRDFFNEWVYFTYPLQPSVWKFPTQSFLYNYRDKTWAILYEHYTAQGLYRQQQKKTWLTTGYKSWNAWKTPWNSPPSAPLFPSVIGGNAQGYVLFRDQGTGEAPSGTIAAVSTSGVLTITSINHCTAPGDYIYISGCIGTVGAVINGQIGMVTAITSTTITTDFAVSGSYTYLGLGQFTRLSQPLMQTKQFNPYWDQGRQARLSAQKYLLDRTTNGQVTVNIYLSMDATDAWNSPGASSLNGLVYSQLMYTCPESTNLGLTPANTNLQMPTAASQNQIWHRFNTSLIGDTVQVGITLSDAQMRNLQYATEEITLHGIHLTVDKSSHLA